MPLTIRPEVARTRVIRALEVCGRGIRYRLGHGGTHPRDEFPTRDGWCDCSGFIAWLLGLNRMPKPGRPWWIETTNIYRDAMSGKAHSTFVRLSGPQAGCLVVYPDKFVLGKKVREGHIGLVVSDDGARFETIDCAADKGGKTLESIRRRDRTALWLNRGAIFVALRQDLA